MMKSFLKFAVIIGITLLLSGCTSTKDVEEIACKYVSVIIQDEWNELARTNGSFRKYMSSGNYRPATCAAVKLGEPLRKNYWHDATAYLHNGKDVGITVEVKDGHVYVQMTEDLFWRWKY